VTNEKLSDVKVLIFGAGGVLYPALTPYTVKCQESYELTLEPIIQFHLRDGSACNELLPLLNIPFIVVEGRPTEAVKLRTESQGGIFVAGGKNKLALTTVALEELGLGWEDAAYMGDDLNDWQLMKNAFFQACPRDANEFILEKVRANDGFVAEHDGGQGAIADLIHALVRSHGIDLFELYDEHQYPSNVKNPVYGAR